MNYNELCVCAFLLMTEYYKCVLLSVNSGTTDTAKSDIAS